MITYIYKNKKIKLQVTKKELYNIIARADSIKQLESLQEEAQKLDNLTIQQIKYKQKQIKLCEDVIIKTINELTTKCNTIKYYCITANELMECGTYTANELL